jgi:cytolysin-activating lysine-acyltransferase
MIASSFLSVLDESSPKRRSEAELWGFMSILLARHPHHGADWPRFLVEIFEPALAHKMVKFFFNDEGRVVGYVIWAWLAEDVEERVRQTGRFELHESEWNEGDRLWVIDLLAPFGNFKYIARRLKAELLEPRRDFSYVRPASDGSGFAVITRRRTRASLAAMPG